MTAASRILLLLLCLVLPCHADSEASPEALAIIDELGLSAGSDPINKHPQWQPRRVLVTLWPRIAQAMPDYEQQLQAAAGDVELVFDRTGSFVPAADLLAGADGLIGLCTPQALANAGEQLLWLHNYSVGMDRCTGLSEAQLQRMVFTNNKRLSGPAIAEHSIAMLLSLARGLPAYQLNQADSNWDRSAAAGVQFGELRGKTLLVVGLGGIGTEIAWRAHGLGMRVIATRNSSRRGPEYVEYVGLADELHELAGRADVVVNALPLTSSTTGLFDQDFFDAVKPGAIFLSVGRGRSTVTADLVAALEDGRLYGAGLDVTDPEPLPENHPLWAMDRVIITPHVAAAGSDSLRRSAVIALENLRRYVAGEALLNQVNMQRGY